MDLDRRGTLSSGAGIPGLLGLLQRRAYLPVFLLVPALIIGFGLLLPRATSSAATVVESAEVDGFFFERSDDNLLGITDKAQSLRLELDIETASAPATEEQLNSLKTEVATLVKDTYGWDLNSSTDRTRLRDEILLLGQTLHTIPDESFNVEEYKPLLALRDVADGMEGVSECRGRCLDGEVKNRIISVTVGAIVNRILAEFTGDALSASVAAAAVSVFAGTMTEFVFRTGPALTDIPVETLQQSAIAGAISTLILVKSFLRDAKAMADKNSGTVREEVEKGIQEVQGAALSEVDTKDYDLIKDEF